MKLSEEENEFSTLGKEEVTKIEVFCEIVPETFSLGWILITIFSSSLKSLFSWGFFSLFFIGWVRHYRCYFALLNIELSCFSVYFPFQICRCKRGGLGGGTDTLKMKKRIVFQWVLQGLSQLENVTVAPMRYLSGWNSSRCSLGKKVTVSNAVCAFNFQNRKWESGFIFGIWD